MNARFKVEVRSIWGVESSIETNQAYRVMLLDPATHLCLPQSLISLAGRSRQWELQEHEASETKCRTYQPRSAMSTSQTSQKLQYSIHESGAVHVSIYVVPD